MHSKKPPDTIYNVNIYLKKEIKHFSKNILEFGYKERIIIERCLFILIKIICKDNIKYNLQGFNDFHKEKILVIVSDDKLNNNLYHIINQIFQLKIFLQKLSSKNGYVRGDSLTNLGLKRKDVLNFIDDQFNSIIKKINYLYEE